MSRAVRTITDSASRLVMVDKTQVGILPLRFLDLFYPPQFSVHPLINILRKRLVFKGNKTLLIWKV